MRIFVFFDLPTSTKEERSAATAFRNQLIKDGFFMMQYSIYSRICRGQDNAERYKARVKSYLPEDGHVRMMQVTEKQYAAIEILLGTQKLQEKAGAQQLSLF